MPTIMALVAVFLAQLLTSGNFTSATQADVKRLQETDAAIRQELMPLPERMRIFVPRSEFEMEVKHLKEQASRIEVLVKDTNDKIDALSARSGILR